MDKKKNSYKRCASRKKNPRVHPEMSAHADHALPFFGLRDGAAYRNENSTSRIMMCARVRVVGFVDITSCLIA